MLLWAAAMTLLAGAAAFPPPVLVRPAAGQPGRENEAHPSATGSPARPAAAVPFPHPIITEVLYAVPPGPGGDANKDGQRDATGDEFVELVNPHDKPIQLFGYTLTDSQEPGKGQLRFVFPAFELPPGGVVVVFNGMNSQIPGPVGDSRTVPAGASEAFGGAWVFSLRNTNAKVALGNSGDHVLLTAPDGTPVQRVWWTEDPAGARSPGHAATPGAAGTPNPTGPGAGPGLARPGAGGGAKPPIIDDAAPLVQRMSVTRDSVLGSGRFVPTMDAEHTSYSPGVYALGAAPGAPAGKP